MQGKFITFEGIDGAGKSTHIEATKAQICAAGIECIQTREPGGTPLGEKIRALFLNETMMPLTELMLVFAARREHLETVIWPALSRGAWVICDRFTDATVAYQSYGRGLGIEPVETLAQFIHPDFSPDLTLWFDVAPDIAAARVAAGRTHKDRFEREQAQFFARVREGYAAVAASAPQRVVRIDAEMALAEVALAVQRAVAGVLR